MPNVSWTGPTAGAHDGAMTPDPTATPNPLAALGLLSMEATDDAALEKSVRDRVTPAFTFRVDGRDTDVEGYLAHLRELRASFAGAELTVLHELVDRTTDPARAAVRFTLVMRMDDGSTVQGEAHTFALLDGDRVAALYDIGRILGPDDDRP